MAFKTLGGRVIKASLFDADDSVAQELVGTVVEGIDENGLLNAYKYVQFAADTTGSDGLPVAYTDTNKTTVTSDISDSSRNFVAGVAVAAVTAENYGWIQTKGYHSAVATNGDNDISAGDAVIYASTDGQVDSVAAGTAPTYKTLGFAAAADVDANNTVAVYVDVD